MNIKRSTKFSLNVRSCKTKDLPIRMRITFKGNRLDFLSFKQLFIRLLVALKKHT